MKSGPEINYNNLTARIFGLISQDQHAFESLALEVFRLQFEYNPVYNGFCALLRVSPEKVKKLQEVPFLPISFFKSQRVVTDLLHSREQIVFTSSGTTGQEVSKHYVSDPAIYEASFERCFEIFYGDVKQYCVIGVLPSYLEREGSSLVYMMQKLIEKSAHADSGFYLHDMDKLVAKLQALKKNKQKTFLLGVSYALLDLADKGIQLDENFVVMETGGMKGRREELLKAELHRRLKSGLGVQNIHSEYGMTELLSQAYSKSDGIFTSPPWMKIMVRDTNDPFAYLASHRTGGINVVDLANINSCSFIATQDLGKETEEGHFELMGRFDNSDIRGCNLMVE